MFRVCIVRSMQVTPAVPYPISIRTMELCGSLHFCTAVAGLSFFVPHSHMLSRKSSAAAVVVCSFITRCYQCPLPGSAQLGSRVVTSLPKSSSAGEGSWLLLLSYCMWIFSLFCETPHCKEIKSSVALLRLEYGSKMVQLHGQVPSAAQYKECLQHTQTVSCLHFTQKV